MKRTLVNVALVVAMFNPLSLLSQMVAAQTTPAAARGSVTVDLVNVPLSRALNEIAVQAGMRLIRETTRAKLDKQVTVHLKNASVEQSLAVATRGTDVVTQVSDDRTVILVKVGPGERGLAQGIITGKVVDAKSGRGISGARVSVESRGHSAMTDEAGQYRLSGIASGTYTVIARLVGYAKQSRSVTVGEGATVTADFKLEPSASVLDQVVVTGTVVATELKAVPSAITVVTAKQIEERGITRIDQLFRGDVPGLFSLNMGSNLDASLDEVLMFSRGASAIPDVNGNSFSAGATQGTTAIKTYIDGVEMADPKYLSQIDPKSIERIEILTGPQASTIYGANAINGVMQVFTKRGSTVRPQLTLNLTSGVAQNNFSSHLAPSYITDASLSGVEGKVSYNVGGSWNYAGAWTPAKQTQRLSANGGARMALGKLNVDISARQGSTKNRQRGGIGEGQFSSNLRAIGVYKMNAFVVQTPQDQTLLGHTFGLSLSYRPFAWWSHEVGVGSDASETESLQFKPSFAGRSDTALSITSNATTRASQRYNTTIQLPISSLARLNLTMGGDHWRTTGSSLLASPSTSLIGTITPVTRLTRTHPDKNSGAFVQGQLGLEDVLFFTYGVRADWNPNYGEKVKVKPGRYGISYTHDMETPLGPMSAKLRGSYGRSIRPPAAGRQQGSFEGSAAINAQFAQVGQFYATLPNPELGPEHQQGGEGGIELYLGSRASLVVTRYNQTVENLIFIVSDIDSIRSLNPSPPVGCSSSVLDAEGYCYRRQNQFGNVGDIRNQGWELQSSLNTGPFTTRGTYSWTKSRILGVAPKYRSFFMGSSVIEPGRSFGLLPEHTWALGLDYSHAANSLSLSVNGSGMRYVSRADELFLAVSSNVRLDNDRPRILLRENQYRPMGAGYATADLNATHRFSTKVEATLQVNNLANYYQNDFSADYAAIGRQSRIGARIRF